MTRRFDTRYRETARLADGSNVLLRLMVPADKEFLRRGFNKLSPESRYLRFFSPKGGLSDEELGVLTDLDHEDRLAVAAMTRGGQADPEGLGVARYVRDPKRPEVAEAAVTVVDHAQGKGLGSLLLHRLAAAARERGIERFACEFLAQNRAVLHLLEELGADVVFDHDPPFVRAEVRLDDDLSRDPAQLPGRQGAVFRVLAQSARGALEVRLQRLLLKLT